MHFAELLFLYLFFSLKGVGIFGSVGGGGGVVDGGGKGLIRIYTSISGCLFLTGDLNLRLCMVGTDCSGCSSALS